MCLPKTCCTQKVPRTIKNSDHSYNTEVIFWQMEMAKYRKDREEEKLHILKTETADEH